MTRYIWLRFSALVAFSLLVAVFFSHSMWHKHLLGQSGYLQAQATYFEKNLAHMAGPSSKTFGFTVVFGLVLGLYELLVLAFSKLFRVPKRSEQINNV